MNSSDLSQKVPLSLPTIPRICPSSRLIHCRNITGAYGVVVECVDQTTGEHVAIKKMKQKDG